MTLRLEVDDVIKLIKLESIPADVIWFQDRSSVLIDLFFIKAVHNCGRSVSPRFDLARDNNSSFGSLSCSIRAKKLVNETDSVGLQKRWREVNDGK